jgi:hypothetical protein
MNDFVDPKLMQLYQTGSHAFEWLKYTSSLVKAVNAAISIITPGYGKGAKAVATTLRFLTITPTATEAGLTSVGVAAVAWPALVGAAAIAGEFLALGGGYEAVGQVIAEKAATRGYAYGVVLGAMREQWGMVQQFIMYNPSADPGGVATAGSVSIGLGNLRTVEGTGTSRAV